MLCATVASTQSSAQPIAAYRFGPFEADLRRCQLRKLGSRVRLERKPWQLLLRLLESPGELVTRAEMERSLWGEGVFVDFEHGVNVAVKKVRAALCDSAEAPTYIETISGEGYRFIGIVETVYQPISDIRVLDLPLPGAAASAQRVSAAFHTRRWPLVVAIVGAIAVLMIVTIAARTAFRPHISRPIVERLTGNAPEQAVFAAAISPDGRYLVYVTHHGIWLKQIASGEVHSLVSDPQLTPRDISWDPDSNTLLAVDSQGVWRLSILGGKAQRIYGPAFAAAVSADRHLAITSPDRRSVWVADSDGEHPHQVFSLPGDSCCFLSRPSWSPQGKRIAVMKDFRDSAGNLVDELDTLRADGSEPSVVLRQFPIRGAHWMADGRLVYLVLKPPEGTNNLWAIPVDERTGKPTSDAQPLTDWPNFDFKQPSSSRDGREIAFVRMLPQSDVYTAEISLEDAHLSTPQRVTFGASYTYSSAGVWDEANHALLVVRLENGKKVILRQPPNGAPAEPAIPASPNSQFAPQFSADGHWLLWIRAAKDFQSAEVLRIPRTGGPAEVIDQQPGGAFWLRCPAHPNVDCLFIARVDDETHVHAIEPESAKARDLFHFATTGTYVDFDLAPAGDKVLVCDQVQSRDDNSGKVFILNLPGGDHRRDLPFGCPEEVVTWRWLPDGKGWLVARINHNDLIRVDSSGATTVLSQGIPIMEPLLLPDGRHIAFSKSSAEMNVWMLKF